MKKILTLLLVLALSIAVFASCDVLVKIPGVGDLVTELCEHEWVDATCTTVKTCTKCGKTEGEALGHTWNAATCTEAKTCSVCGATEGEAAGHTWQNATCTAAKKCSVCGVTEGEALGHSYGTDGNCVCGKMDPLYEALLDASAYIRQLYKDDPTYTPADLNLVANVTIGDYVFPIVWTVNATEISVVATPDGKSVIVDIPDITEDSIKEIPYTLTATVSTENGYVATRTFEHVVPKFEVNTWEDYAKAETGTPLMVEGIVVLINSKSAGNTRNNLFVMDATGVGGYYNYQMETDPIADLGIKVGMTVRISGEAAPYNGLPEFKNATVKIIDETIKTFDFIDITEKFQKDTNYNLLVALPVVIKGVTLGDQDLTEKSQYMKFSLNGVESYIRTYVTDFPAGVLDADDKVVIDTLHKENFGNKADVYGILITYSGNPYLIPVSVDCFTNIQQPERTDAEKLELELGGITLPEAVTEDTVINLPLTGSAYETVKFSWKVDNEAFVIGEDGKVDIKLSGNAVTLKFTLTATVGEETATKEFTVEVASNFVMSEKIAYTPYIYQGTNGVALYLDGGVSGRYLTTTTNAAQAVEVYAEKADGGYKFYILVDDAKQYINLYLNDEGKTSVNYAETTDSVFTYNPVTNALCTVLNGSSVYLGTYSTFNTISVSSTSYINADNTGVSQFPLDVLAGTPAVEEHTCEFVAGETVDPTCTEDGYTVYTCTCGKTENRDVVKATGHSHEQVIGWHPQMVAADCTTSGVDVYVCACGDTYTVEIGTDPDAHAFWGDEEIITEANCATQTNGLKKVSCANGCGAIEEQEIYYEYSHEWDVQDETAATCTTDGHYYAVCTLCEEVEEYSSEAQGHYNWYLTCGETGACMECGVEFTKQHNLTEATCTEAPFCYDCWSEVGEALGHNYVGGTCENCGEMDPAGHTCEFVAGETVDPTCTEAGYTVYTCEGCGATENRDEVAATGHVNTTENVVDATCTTAGSKTVVCACGETVSTETIDALGHDYADGICGNCNGEDPDYYFESTIPEVLASADGKKVIVSGVVVSAEAWNTTYKNMSVTIKDENGDTLYIFRLATQVGLGDTITVTGVVGSYNEEKQIAAGSTAVIDVVHGDNHTYVDGYCTVCNSKQPSAGEETTVCDFSTVSGTQYADETKTFGDIVVSTHNKGCHFNTQLRIYDSSTNNGWAILTSESGKTMSALTINMGYKKATLNVYASVDGEEWVLVEAVATTSTSYLDYTVDIDESLGYKYIKIDASGAQLRVAKITLTTVG